MELVKLWYKYLNRFINSDELLEELQNLNLNKYTIDTKSEIKRLIILQIFLKNFSCYSLSNMYVNGFCLIPSFI